MQNFVAQDKILQKNVENLIKFRQISEEKILEI